MTKLSISALLLLSVSSSIFANQQIINIDGREVLLNADGSWHYRSTDRYADTADGRRVRLKEDGSWQYIGNAPLDSKEHVRTADLDLKLQRVVIETHEKKVQKNTRVKTQTVFHINLQYSSQAKTDISIKQGDITKIQVKDNKGKNYPVLSIQPGSAKLKPGTDITIVIRADKSPSIWDDAKSMEIVFNPDIFGIKQPISLIQKTIDFDKKKVDGFD